MASLPAAALHAQRQREAMEAEMRAIVVALSAPGMGGVAGPLVAGLGRPRTDIDVQQTAMLRHRLACISMGHLAVAGLLPAAPPSTGRL